MTLTTKRPCREAGDLNDAQRVPLVDAAIVGTFRECAQTISVLPAKSAMFSGDFETGDGLKNRCTLRRKSWIQQVPILSTLSVCGEVAEWPKAAVC